MVIGSLCRSRDSIHAFRFPDIARRELDASREATETKSSSLEGEYRCGLVSFDGNIVGVGGFVQDAEKIFISNPASFSELSGLLHRPNTFEDILVRITNWMRGANK